jgi:PAS domain S-box-containing protein
MKVQIHRKRAAGRGAINNADGDGRPRRQPAPRGAGSGDAQAAAGPNEMPGRAQQRLRDMYEIGRLLTRLETSEGTVAAVMAVAAQTLPLRSAVLMVDVGSGLSTVVWKSGELSRERVRAVKAHARSVYAYFSRGVCCGKGHRPTSAAELAKGSAGLVSLPLAVDRDPVFGVLQIEGECALDEGDLAFVNALVNQLAVALRGGSTLAPRSGALAVSKEAGVTGRAGAKGRERQAGGREGGEGREQGGGEEEAAAELLRSWSEERRGSAELLRRRYEALVDNLDHAFVWEADPATLAFTYMSGRAERLFGFPMEAWLRAPAFHARWVHPDDLSAVVDMLRKAVDGEDQRCDHRCITVDGRVVWLHTGVHLARDASGEPRLQGVSLDITSAKEAEEGIKDELGFTLAVTGSLGEGVVAVDLDQRVTFINPAAEELLGWTRAEVLGSHVDDILEIRRSDGTFIEPDARPIAHALQTGEPCRDDDCLFLGRERNAWPSSLTASAIRRHGRTEGAVLAFRQIVDLKRGERVHRFLAEMSEALSSSLDVRRTAEAVARFSVPFFADVCVIDMVEADESVSRLEVAVAHADASAVAEQLRAYAPRSGWHTPEAITLTSARPIYFSEMPPEVIEEICHDAWHAELLRDLGMRSMIVVPLIARGRVIGVLTFGAAASGRRYCWADVPLAEEIAHRAATAIDNARLHEAARKAVRDREEILGVVSHDLQNPLSAILMSAALLLQAGPSDSSEQLGRKRIEIIKRSAERMARMLKDLLDVSSIDAGHLSVHTRPHPVGALAEEALEAHASLAAQRSLRLDISLPADGALVCCDRGRVLQVLSNLIGNAIKFTPPGGSVLLEVSIDGGRARFAVADTGPGIPKERISRVLDRYWQAPETASKGTGLGLYISKGIVEAHGGRIWVESTVGRGSTFFFTLPLASASASDAEADRPDDTREPAGDREPESSRPSARGQPRNNLVLVVDDDREVRDAHVEMLRSRGFRVAVAHDGAEALAYLRSSELPGLILLDLVMPNMNGWQFLAEKRGDPALEPIPVIVTSGGEQGGGLAAGAQAAYMAKPIRPQDLLRTIAHVAR